MTNEQLRWLKWLYENGESAWIDQWGRLIANGATSHQGAQTSWLNLILKGFVEARENRFRITEAGYKQLNLEPRAQHES